MPILKEKTIHGGALIEAYMPMLITTLDAARELNYVEASTVTTYAPAAAEKLGLSDPWWVKVFDEALLVSLCFMASSSYRCVLSREGQVNIYGPGGKPDYTYQIPQAGVSNNAAIGLGYVNRMRAIGRTLFVCGQSRQVYRFVWDGANLVSGSWQDMAAAVRQPPLSEPPSDPGDLPALNRWLDDNDSVDFSDIAGTDENDIYAAGDETWHWNGAQWRQLQLPTDEAINAIKVVNADEVIMVGHNGTVLLGNARQGFKDLSGIDDNQNFVGVEICAGILWLASNVGLYVWDAAKRRIAKYQTDLEVDLVDTHVLEAKDGVLWSFGFKDLAYLDTTQEKPHWVRVHHPDNARVDEPQPKKARQARATQRLQTAQAEAAMQAATTIPNWLPEAHQGGLDLGGIMRRVGHTDVSDYLLSQLAPFGMTASQLLQAVMGQRYSVTIPGQGITLTLEYLGQSKKPTTRAPRLWGLAEVMLTAHGPSGHVWRGAWPAGIEPHKPGWRERVQAVFGEQDAGSADQVSFFVGGAQGAAWVLNLQGMPKTQALHSLRLAHMGGYLPWANPAQP